MGVHSVRFHSTGVKHFKHPAVGELHLNFNRLDLAADPGLTLFTHIAEAGSRDEDALKLLGSWALIVDPAESARMADQSWSPNATRGRPEGDRLGAAALHLNNEDRCSSDTPRKESSRTSSPTAAQHMSASGHSRTCPDARSRSLPRTDRETNVSRGVLLAAEPHRAAWIVEADRREARPPAQGVVRVAAGRSRLRRMGAAAGARAARSSAPSRRDRRRSRLSIERDDDLAVGVALLDVRQRLEGLVERERVVDDWAKVAGVVEGSELAQLGAVGLHEQKRVAHA